LRFVVNAQPQIGAAWVSLWTRKTPSSKSPDDVSSRKRPEIDPVWLTRSNQIVPLEA